MPAETPIFVVFGDFEWAPKKGPFSKTDSCNENAQFFYLPNTNSVCLFFKKLPFLQKHLLCSQPPKKHNFSGFFWTSRFPCFSYFLVSFSNIKKTKTKSAHSLFKNSFFDTLTNCQQIIFAPLHTICVFKITKKHYKIGEKQAKKKSWTKFWRNLGPSFDSKHPKSWTKFWLYSIYICCKVKNWSKIWGFIS